MNRHLLIMVASLVLVATGLPFAVLGYQGAFNYVSCPRGAYGCINAFAFSNLALVLGSVAMVIGVIGIFRTLYQSRS